MRFTYFSVWLPAFDEDNTKHPLENFLNGERFQAFPKIVGAGLNEMAELDKKIVIFVFSDKTTDQNSRFER